MGRHRTLSILVTTALLASLVAPVAPALAKDASVEPGTLDLAIAPGASQTRDITVKLGSRPIPKVDVLFVFDVTGSMGDEINAAKRRGTEIMDAIRGKVPDSAFGLASFADYPGNFTYDGYTASYGGADDYPWRLNNKITADKGAVQTAINGLSLGYGADTPEDYSRVVYEAAESVNWRSGAKRIVVLFGDAPPHDLEFGGRNTGGDPGRDQKADTKDDLRYSEVVRNASAKGLHFLTIDSSGGEDSVVEAFKYLARETGGQYARLDDAGALPKTAIGVISRATERVGRIELVAKDAYKSWVSASPASSGSDRDRTAGQKTTFKLKVSPPKDATRGVHSFTVDAMADGAFLGAVSVTVVTGKRSGGVFDPSKHGFSFENESSVASWEQMERYFERPMCVSASGERLWAAQRFFDTFWQQTGTGGSCYGMAAAEAAIFLKKDGDHLFTGGARDIPALKTAGTESRKYSWCTEPHNYFRSNPVADLVADYQARQWDVRHDRQKYEDAKKNDPAEVGKRIVEWIEAGEPVIVCISGMYHGKMAGHAVVGYAYRYEGSTLHVKIHDSNTPASYDREIVFDLKKNRWSENIEYLDWKGDTKKSNISASPVGHVVGPGVAFWNPGRGAHDDSAVIYQDAKFEAMTVVDAATGNAIAPLPAEQLSDSAPKAFYIPNLQSVRVSAESTVASAAASYFAPGVSASLYGLSSGMTSATLSASGDVTLSGTGGERSFSFAASREASGSSKVVEVVGAKIGGSGSESIKASPDFRTVDFVNRSADTSYGVRVRSISDTAVVYGEDGLTVSAGDRHSVVVADWASLDAAPPVLLVDKGDDGSIDETITLALMTGGGGGGGGTGGDGGLFVWLMVLAFGGMAGLTLLSSRKAATPEGEVDVAGAFGGDRAALEIVDEGGRASALREGLNTLGRDADNDVVVNDPTVSRHHAVLDARGTSLRVSDLNSTAGTLVNGRRVEQASVVEGDALSFGDARFIVRQRRRGGQ